MEDELGIKNIDTGIGSAGVGFVVVPTDVDREEYINDCYRTNTLTINGGKGYGFFSGVHTDVNVMQNISFPTDERNRGTAVVWVRDAISQLPVIIASLRKQDEYYNLAENQFRIKRNNVEKTKAIEIFADGDESCIDIILLSDEITPANFNIKINSKNQKSILNINCDNEINIVSDNKIKIETNKKVEIEITEEGETKTAISYELGKGFIYKDEFENEINCKDGEINIISEKINHNGGKEPMVLGDTLVDLLRDVLSEIQKMTFTSPSGITSTPINSLSFLNIQNELSKIKSKKSNVE